MYVFSLYICTHLYCNLFTNDILLPVYHVVLQLASKTASYTCELQHWSQNELEIDK